LPFKVVVVGGGSNGTDAWSPDTGIVATLSEDPPSEDSIVYSAITVNHGSQLLYYGPIAADGNTKVSRFTIDTQAWDEIGQLLFPRAYFGVLPIPGVDSDLCPPV
jgi:hypothetical protein